MDNTIINRKIDNNGKTKLRVNILVIALLAIALVLSAVIILRLMQNKPLLPAGESYYNLRLAQSLKANPF